MGEFELLEALVGGVFALFWYAFKLLEWLLLRFLPFALEIFFRLVWWIIFLPSRVRRAVQWLYFVALPRLASTLASFFGWFESVFYKFFPSFLLAKERREKAELLITYEELVKKREGLLDVLAEQGDLLEDLASKIDSVDEEAFERRREGKSAESVMQSFDVQKLLPYEKIKATAIEYENTLFHVFTVCKKLELYGIDRGVKEIEGR